MSENEKKADFDGDLIPVDIPKEINTYDIPELSFDERDEKTQCFSVSNAKRPKKRLLYIRSASCCRFTTVSTTWVFSRL